MSIGKFLGRKVVTTFSGAVSGAAGAVVDTATDVMKSVVGGATDVGLQVRKKKSDAACEQLHKIKALFDAGVISQSEFESKKHEIIKGL